MEKAIAENRWYLSEVAGKDVGLLVAEQNFHDHHLPRVAAEFRTTYCTKLCPAKSTCELAPLVPELNDTWAKRLGH